MQAPPSSATGSTPQLDPAELGLLVTQVDALAEIPAGPELATALSSIDCDRLPGVLLVGLMEARNRQSNHERGELLAAVGRILRHDVPGGPRMWKGPDGVAVDQVRATLRLTRSAAKRLCALVWDLHKRLTPVLAAMRRGGLDQPRARVFSLWTAGLSDEHTTAVLRELLPTAAALTTGELIDAIAKLAIALDPEWVRRRYERALKGRRVVGTRNPDGTATLTGHDLPLDEVAAACARLDALAHAAKTAGHPDRLDHLRADLLVGMITGRYTAMTDQQILATLLATTTKPDTTGPADHTDDAEDAEDHTDNAEDGPHDQDGTDDEDPDRNGDDDEGPDGAGPDGEGPDGNGPDGNGPDGADPDDGEDDGPRGGSADDQVGAGADDQRAHDQSVEDSNDPGAGRDDPDDDCAGGDASDGDGLGCGHPGGGHPGGTGAGGVNGDGSDREPPGGPRSRLGRRGGLRLWAGLLTVMGGDERPGELLGWGPVHAELACDLARSLPSWWCVLTGEGGALLAVVPIRRRPPPTTPPHATSSAPDRRKGECWLSVDADMLTFLNTMDRIGMFEPGWSRVLAEITTSLEAATTGPPNGDPTARLPGAALRRWIHIRDRRCSFPGCRAPAHRADADHTIEHARGGATVDTDLGPACRHDHLLRHEGGWTVTQPEPGRIVWTSPLGLRYERIPPLELNNLPEPRPGAVREDTVDPDEPELYGDPAPSPWWDPPSCLPQDPPPPPTLPHYLDPPPGQRIPDEEIPF